MMDDMTLPSVDKPEIQQLESIESPFDLPSTAIEEDLLDVATLGLTIAIAKKEPQSVLKFIKRANVNALIINGKSKEMYTPLETAVLSLNYTIVKFY